VNKSNAIEVDSVKARLKQLKAEALLADFTFKDSKIGAEIRSFGRAGVPLVVVYPADPNAAPILMPDGFFTASRLLEALDLAASGPQLQARKE
jgi:thiol:disulfide interchange protein DsbD